MRGEPGSWAGDANRCRIILIRGNSGWIATMSTGNAIWNSADDMVKAITEAAMRALRNAKESEE